MTSLLLSKRARRRLIDCFSNGLPISFFYAIFLFKEHIEIELGTQLCLHKRVRDLAVLLDVFCHRPHRLSHSGLESRPP